MALTTISYVAGTTAEFQLPDHTQLLISTFPDGIKLWLVEEAGSPGELLWRFAFPEGLEFDQASELAKNTLDLALRSIGDCENLEDVEKQLTTTTAPLLSHYLTNRGPDGTTAAAHVPQEPADAASSPATHDESPEEPRPEDTGPTGPSVAIYDKVEDTGPTGPSVAIYSDADIEATEPVEDQAAVEGYMGAAEAAIRDESAATEQSADIELALPVSEEGAASEHRDASDGTPDTGGSEVSEEIEVIDEGVPIDHATWMPPVADLTQFSRPRGLRLPFEVPQLPFEVPRLLKWALTSPLAYMFLFFGLAFLWHIVASMKLEKALVLSEGDPPYTLHINPLTNSVTIRVDNAADVSLAMLGAGHEDILLSSLYGPLLLQVELTKRAGKALDAYGILVPYRIVVESEGSAAPDPGDASDPLAAAPPADEADEPEASDPGRGEGGEGGEGGAGDDERPVPEPAEALDIKLDLVSRQRLKGTVGKAQTSPIGIRVTDQLGRPKEGHPVYFVVAEGSGSVASGWVLTDSHGMAKQFWTLGRRAGEQRLEVRTARPGGGWRAQTIHATARPGPPASRELLLGNTIELVVNQRLSLADKVRVTDRYGNAIDLGSLDFALSVPEGMIIEEKTKIWAALEMRGAFVLRLDPSLEADHIFFRSYYDVTQHPWRYVIAERTCDAGDQADSTHIERNGLAAEYIKQSPAGLPLPGRGIAFHYPEVRHEITWWADGRVDTVEVREKLKGSRLLAKQHKLNALYLNSRWQDFSVVSQAPWTYSQRVERSCGDGSRSFQSRKFVATP